MTARDRQAVRLGLALVMGAILAMRVLPAGVRKLQQDRSDVAQLHGSVIRTRSLLAARSTIEDSLRQSLQTLLARAEWLLQGRTTLEAAANLDATVARVANVSGLRLIEFRAVPDSTGGLLGTVATAVRLEGDVRGLAALLEAVAASESPVLNLATLAVQAPEPAGPEGRAEVLRVEVLVRGWFLRADEAPTYVPGPAP